MASSPEDMWQGQRGARLGCPGGLWSPFDSIFESQPPAVTFWYASRAHSLARPVQAGSAPVLRSFRVFGHQICFLVHV